jgi:hypothetical protein
MEETTEPTGVSIHTGFPNPATDTSLHGLDLHKLLVQHSASTYLFRVRGPRGNDVVLWWDDTRGEFALTVHSKMPPAATCWGVITASIHEFRKIIHA